VASGDERTTPDLRRGWEHVRAWVPLGKAGIRRCHEPGCLTRHTTRPYCQSCGTPTTLAGEET